MIPKQPSSSPQNAMLVFLLALKQLSVEKKTLKLLSVYTDPCRHCDGLKKPWRMSFKRQPSTASCVFTVRATATYQPHSIYVLHLALGVMDRLNANGPQIN